MPYIHNKGNPSSDVWVVLNRPATTDVDRKFIFSGGLGYVWDKMMLDAGFASDDYFVTCFFPDTTNPNAVRNVDATVNQYQPKIILALDACGAKFCQELVLKRRTKTYNPEQDSEVHKYCGSLLTSPSFKYPHYVMPLIGPSTVVSMYKLRDQVILDLAKARHEVEYAKTNGCIQPLPTRNLVTDFSCFDELLGAVDALAEYPRVSNDIETYYPKKGSDYYAKTPGVPAIIALANSENYSISIDLFRKSIAETRELWKRLDKVFRNCITIGQNFFNFDLYFYEALGFTFREVHDTLVRHHILWPELPHSLGHLTRQYTREPYYKDEGQELNRKDSGWKRYNAMDAAVTYEVYMAQESEFADRPYLR